MSLLRYLIFLLAVEFLEGAAGYFSSKEKEGYPGGYLPNCPGSTKPAFVTKRSLKDIGITVSDGSRIYLRNYNYHQAKEIAKDPHVDFKNRKTMFFFNGFLDQPNNAPSYFMTKVYKKLGYNVLILSVHKFYTIRYAIAARFVRPVGKHLAEMLTNLTDAGLDPQQLEFTGVSIGAQVMGFVAKNIQLLTGKNVSQIIALDPAGPCFRNREPQDRLAASDADFVLVIHTNIDILGMAATMGHVDFYVNGGEYQPSDGYWMLYNYMVSHARSYTIWYASMYYHNGFIGIKCDSIQQARSHQCYDRVPRETNVISPTKINKTNTGIFYLATGYSWPYFLGSKGLRKEYQFYSKHISEMNKDDVFII